MQSSKRIIVLLLLIVPIFSRAQSPYKLLLKGEKSPYDSAVGIEIHTYRTETKKLKTADILIDSLLKENQSLTTEVLLNEEVKDNYKFVVDTQEKAMSKKDSLFFVMNKNNAEIYKEATKPTPFFQRPAVIWPIAGGTFLLVEILKGLFNGSN